MAIFLSYRRADSELVVGPIYDRLAAQFSGERVFRDLDSLPIGKPFPDALAEALATARVALIVIGPSWASTKGADGQRRLDDPADYVRLEVENVLNAGIPVVPVLVNRASMPDAGELPASLRALVFRQGLQVRPDPLGETLVRTLLPDAQPGATVVQSTKVSKEGKVVEVVIRVEYEARFGKQNAGFSFAVTADRLEKLEPVRDSRPLPGVASEDSLRRAEDRLQGIWRASSP